MISEHTVTVNDSSKKKDNKLSPEEILSSEEHDAAIQVDTIEIQIERKEHVQKFIDASTVHIANYAKLTCDIRVFKELKSDKSKEPISEELSETLSKKMMQKKWQKIFQTIVSLNFAAFVKRKIQKRKWFLEFIVRKKYITQRLQNYMR